MHAHGTLSTRLSLAFSVLLLACCAASAWLQLRASGQTEQETIQRLSAGLARHIAASSELIGPDGVNEAAVLDLFGKLMVVNPSVEVYLLADDGRILAQAAPPGHLRLQRIDLAPVHRLLGGAPLPIFGEDPRAPGTQKVFSAAPLEFDGAAAGYIYVVLMGEAHEALANDIAYGRVLRTTLWTLALVAAVGLLAGWAAFRWITRPLRRLATAVGTFDQHEPAAAEHAVQGIMDASRGGGGEIAALGRTFAQMARRTSEQWQELSQSDRQRRELFAHLSHDLRTPLTTMHGCLETLLVKADTLAPAQQSHYLEVALGESRKVGRLAQQLFDLARLESGLVRPEMESFALADLVQDLFQKFELAAEARQQRLVAEMVPALPAVRGDLGMIERVLTNLLDNAIRHTPAGGEIVVRLARTRTGGVDVEVCDTGPGIPGELHGGLFMRPAYSDGGRGGGLGLMIVQRMLQLHGSDIRLLQRPGDGAVFAFRLG